MLEVLAMGGFTTGGLNFDAKRRRDSYEPDDLLYAHIAGMDTFARGLKIAAAVRQDGRYEQIVDERYKTWDSDLGKTIESGKSSLEALREEALKIEDPLPVSGRQEMIEALINQFIK